MLIRYKKIILSYSGFYERILLAATKTTPSLTDLHQRLTLLISLTFKLNSLQRQSAWIQNYRYLYNLSIIV